MVRRNFVSVGHMFGILDVNVSLLVLFNPFYGFVVLDQGSVQR